MKKIKLAYLYSIIKGLKIRCLKKVPEIIYQKPKHAFIISLIFVLFVYAMFFRGNMQNALSATFGWVQTDWSGGVSTTAGASHLTDRTGWNKFFSKGAGITAATTVTLTGSSSTWALTSNGDFGSNTASNTYITGGSIKLLKPVGATCTLAAECAPGGCSGSNLCYVPPCGGATSTLYSSQTYRLVEIGDQCWFAENLNVGTKLASGPTVPSNNSLVEKWCYSNSDANCTTYGGLYTFAEAMQLDPSCNGTTCATTSPHHQGVCPSGYHIPTDSEVKTMEVSLGMSVADSNLADVDRGTTEGDELKPTGACEGRSPCGTSGFNLLFSGRRQAFDGSFENVGNFGYFWTATQDAGSVAYIHLVYVSTAFIYRTSNSQNLHGFPVRCLKD